MPNNNRIFYTVLVNCLIATVTNAFVWFALTFWVYLETRSIIATSYIAGTFAIMNALSALFFGAIVDHNKKKMVMVYSSLGSLAMYSAGALLFFSVPTALFRDPTEPTLWALIILLMSGSILGNLRMIALSTTVTILFSEDDRDKANGWVGTMNGVSFSITSILSGLVIGFLGMEYALGIAIALTAASLFHILSVRIPEQGIVHTTENATIATSRLDIKGTLKAINSVPGLLALIFFTTFNNFLGGVFMALMDAYGLSLVSVQTWGFLWGALSLAFIGGGLLIAKFGLGNNPVKTLFTINLITWTICIFFTIQPSVILLALGMFLWLLLMPFIEASEQTIIQKVVPLNRQGRVFGFAHSIESAASPITAFLIGPITQFFFIPFMTTGAGVALIGGWFGTGPDRGMALVFTVAGLIGLMVTFLARLSRPYYSLSAQYQTSQAAEDRAANSRD